MINVVLENYYVIPKYYLNTSVPNKQFLCNYSIKIM